MINIDIYLDAVNDYPWRNVRPHSTKLICSSPFGERADDTPSFYINTDPSSQYFGYWNDKGAIDPNWSSGGPIKLYAYIRNITYQEAQEELTDSNASDTPILRIKLPTTSANVRPKAIDISEYISEEVPYLTGRGITPEVQCMFDAGYDAKRKAAVMPWKSIRGDVLNAKFRATWGKAFWYSSGGAPVKSMIFGIDLIYAQRIKRALIVEAEIDCMFAWSCGVPAIAIGGAEFTDERAEMLRRSPIEELLHGEDNDPAGLKVKRQVIEKMRGYCEQYDVVLPNGVKDINEIGSAEIVRGICDNASKVPAQLFR